MEVINVDQLTQSVLHDMNDELGKLMKGTCIFINSGLLPPLDEELRVIIEDICENVGKRAHLIVVLETTGGYMETVERLVSIMRSHYGKVSFVIPDHAYSAGTILALSGDNIYMDYYSVLGPIDPQYREAGASGVGYLTKYKELAEQINKAGSSAKAELAFLINNFDPAQLFSIEQAIHHGRSLVTEWLPKYKFKDWKETKTKKEKVTPKMKKDRAEKIAKILGDAEKWHSHGRGISIKELSGPEIKLEIDDFGKDKELSHLIRNYHGLCVDYYSRSGIKNYIHSSQGMRSVS